MLCLLGIFLFMCSLVDVASTQEIAPMVMTVETKTDLEQKREENDF